MDYLQCIYCCKCKQKKIKLNFGRTFYRTNFLNNSNAIIFELTHLDLNLSRNLYNFNKFNVKFLLKRKWCRFDEASEKN